MAFVPPSQTKPKQVSFGTTKSAVCRSNASNSIVFIINDQRLRTLQNSSCSSGSGRGKPISFDQGQGEGPSLQFFVHQSDRSSSRSLLSVLVLVYSTRLSLEDEFVVLGPLLELVPAIAELLRSKSF